MFLLKIVDDKNKCWQLNYQLIILLVLSSGAYSSIVSQICLARLRTLLTKLPQHLRPSQKRSYAVLVLNTNNKPKTMLGITFSKIGSDFRILRLWKFRIPNSESKKFRIIPNSEFRLSKIPNYSEFRLSKNSDTPLLWRLLYNP